MAQPLWRLVWKFLRKLKIELPYDVTVPFLGIFLEKTIIRKDPCISKFIIALFTIDKIMEVTSVSINRRMEKDDVHTYSGILLSHKNGIVSFSATWMDIEIIIGKPDG